MVEALQSFLPRFLSGLLDESPLTQTNLLISLHCQGCVCASRGFWKRVLYQSSPHLILMHSQVGVTQREPLLMCWAFNVLCVYVLEVVAQPSVFTPVNMPICHNV